MAWRFARLAAALVGGIRGGQERVSNGKIFFQGSRHVGHQHGLQEGFHIHSPAHALASYVRISSGHRQRRDFSLAGHGTGW